MGKGVGIISPYRSTPKTPYVTPYYLKPPWYVSREQLALYLVPPPTKPYILQPVPPTPKTKPAQLRNHKLNMRP